MAKYSCQKASINSFCSSSKERARDLKQAGRNSGWRRFIFLFLLGLTPLYHVFKYSVEFIVQCQRQCSFFSYVNANANVLSFESSTAHRQRHGA